MGPGRPGWHIECSAMVEKHLPSGADMHGGGTDLLFPHHENELAQSCGAHPDHTFVRAWVHHGMVNFSSGTGWQSPSATWWTSRGRGAPRQ